MKSTTEHNILVETTISLAEAQKELTPILGRRPCKRSLTRWIHTGVRGKKLRAVRIGNSFVTSKEELTRFCQFINH